MGSGDFHTVDEGSGSGSGSGTSTSTDTSTSNFSYGGGTVITPDKVRLANKVLVADYDTKSCVIQGSLEATNNFDLGRTDLEYMISGDTRGFLKLQARFGITMEGDLEVTGNVTLPSDKNIIIGNIEAVWLYTSSHVYENLCEKNTEINTIVTNKTNVLFAKIGQQTAVIIPGYDTIITDSSRSPTWYLAYQNNTLEFNHVSIVDTTPCSIYKLPLHIGTITPTNQ